MQSNGNANLVNETLDKAKAGAHETMGKVADASRNAAEAIGKKGDSLKNVEQQFVEDCRGYVQENPVTSLFIAGVAGFVFSRLMSS
jgi:ElaB/YqjD/DUF883 family membrane-anchored ribosome-binding protein